MRKNPADNDSVITEVARVLSDAKSVLFVTGAGVSADSGLPTYRGVGGLYDAGDTEEGVSIEEALSGPMFAVNPALTWKYLWQIGSSCVGAVPNAAHRIIAEIEAEKNDVSVITQNVDGLHPAAGSRNLVEVHGHIFDLYCTKCSLAYSAGELISNYRDHIKLPPKCTRCNGIVRPKVVLFEELLPETVVQSLADISEKRFDVVFAIGTSALFPYIKLPILWARSTGKATVEINPRETEVSAVCRYRIRMGAAEAMERIRVCMPVGASSSTSPDDS